MPRQAGSCLSSQTLGRMIQPLQYAIALDMDGVIFRTTKPKHDAMLSLFPETRQEAISDAILSMSGVPRRQKLATVYEACFGHHPAEAVLQTYLQKYADALQDALAKPVITPGIEEFLERSPSRCFVCSSAPRDEVARQLRMTGLAQHFEGEYGAPMSKVEALRDVAQRVANLAVVFLGDAQADREAAAQVGCAFVAVIGETDQFPNMATPKVTDFVNGEAVLEAINCALVANAA